LAAETLRALAPVYAHPALGTIRVVSDGSKTWFDAGGWRTQVASVASDEGIVLESVTPGSAGFRFKVSTVEGARALVLDDGQRSYTFLEETPGVR
ncbi:MAG: hypothetical protein RR969_09060, partial [Thermomonas sp.]